MNKEKIEKILQELYQYDPSFKEDERGLREILSQVLASRPEVKIDRNFQTFLRQRLAQKPAPEKVFRPASIFPFHKLVWGAAGLALVAVIVLPLYSYLTKEEELVPDSNMAISRVSDEAFGEITASATNSSLRAESATGLGGGGQSTKDSTGTSLIAPDFAGYKYVYSGPLALAGLDNQVLKRVWPEDDKSVDTYLSGLNFNLMDLSSFANAQVTNFTLRQDRDQGYEITVDRKRGTISLAEAWEYWYADTVASKEIENLTATDALSDSEVLALADKFIKDHQVRLTNYGSPEIVSSPAGGLMAENYVAESVSVIYPLVVNSRFVYLASGEKAGLTVNVSQRYGRVTSLISLSSQSYQASAYPLETETANILKLIEQGGIYPTYYGSGSATEYPLGEPSLGYLFISQENEELLVPALVFPVENAESYQKNVVVPIVSGLVENILGERIAPAVLEGSSGVDGGQGTEPGSVNASIVLPD
ncbi:MAG: hypothetical protein WC528_01540 [Patescibacteria group bacterium]